ncbi:MAG: DUF58 domain-containing protein [Caldilineaceae bacterium]|nr:DUF58 domain-containing protein [Caldilineaceae bacterium]
MAEQPLPATEIVTPRLFDETFLRKLDRLAILSRRALAGQIQGERRSPKRGQSVEFADYRPYAPGDDFRRIDWNAYGRLERFFIKLFVEEEDLLVHLLVDASRSMDWGEPNKLEYGVRAAGALGYISLAGLDRVTVTALGGRGHLTPRRGRAQALPLFTFLQNLTGAGEARLAASLKSYAAGAHQPGPLMLISDLMDDGWAEGLRALAARGFDVTVLHVLAPAEVDPALGGDLKLIDAETGAAVEITADYDLLQRYRQSVVTWQRELRDFCGVRGIHYVPVMTSLPFEELLFSLLRQRGVLS